MFMTESSMDWHYCKCANNNVIKLCNQQAILNTSKNKNLKKHWGK